MKKIRDWLFPIGLSVAWIIASGYTVSELSRLPFAPAQKVAVDAQRA